MALTKEDPTTIYEVVEGFSSEAGSFRKGFKVRGNHPAVIAHPKHFMRDSLDDVEKAAARRAFWADSYAANAAPPPAPPPVAPKATGRMRALGTWTILEPELGGPRPLNAGTIVNVDDAIYRAYPHLFGRILEDR